MSSGVRHEPGRCPKGRADGKGDRAGCGGVLLLHGRILGVPADGGQEQPCVGLRHRAGVLRLARRPVWLLGIAFMIAGFVFQLAALRFGPLALVQPILAAELVFVFGYLAVAGAGGVKHRDWLAAAAMSAGIGVFLRVASPSGGRLHAPGSAWPVAGLATLGVVLLALAVAFGLGRRPGASATRRAAVLGAATGISWGFMAAVIKGAQLQHLDNGIGAIFSSWCAIPARGGRRRHDAASLACPGGWTAGRLSAWVHHSRSRSRPACSGCSCSASTSGQGPLTWPLRYWRWAWSSPPPRPSAIAATPSDRTAARLISSRRSSGTRRLRR